jgi:periplasmic protein TonB
MLTLAVPQPYGHRVSEGKPSVLLVLVIALHVGIAAWLLSAPAHDLITLTLPQPLSVRMVAAESAQPRPQSLTQTAPQPAHASSHATAHATAHTPAHTPASIKRAEKSLTPKESPTSAAPAQDSPANAVSPALTSEKSDAQTPTPPKEIPARFDAAYLDNPRPAYPPLSRRLGEEGKVVLAVEVSDDGRATEVTLHRTSGLPRLDAAALAAVSTWRFVPARRGDTAVAARVLVPLVFSLNN